LLCWIERLPAGRFKFHFIRNDQSACLSNAQLPLIERLTQMNRGIEDLIRQAPGQYLWAYARDKQPRPGAKA
jgi:KDO2-lipid IV(A) lauroyltransferase